MADTALRVGFFLAACLAAGLVQGAARGTTPRAILHHGLRSAVSLAGGIGVLLLGVWLVLRVTQG